MRQKVEKTSLCCLYCRRLIETSQHPFHLSHVHNMEQHSDADTLIVADRDSGFELNMETPQNAILMNDTQDDNVHVGRHGDESNGCHGDGSQEMGGIANVSLQQQADDLVTAINNVQSNTKSFFAKWLEELSPSEEFELLCPSRADQLLKEGYALDDSLIEQKKMLQSNLATLNTLLKMPKS